VCTVYYVLCIVCTIRHVLMGRRGLQTLTDSKAMESQRTFPRRRPTAPWDSCPGSRLGSGRE